MRYELQPAASPRRGGPLVRVMSSVGQTDGLHASTIEDWRLDSRLWEDEIPAWRRRLYLLGLNESRFRKGETP